jgi:hypothetical protein
MHYDQARHLAEADHARRRAAAESLFKKKEEESLQGSRAREVYQANETRNARKDCSVAGVAVGTRPSQETRLRRKGPSPRRAADCGGSILQQCDGAQLTIGAYAHNGAAGSPAACNNVVRSMDGALELLTLNLGMLVVESA